MATNTFYSHIDLVLNELQNAKLHILASDPGTPAEGQFWYNSTSKKLLYQTDAATIDIIAQLALKATIASPTFTGTPAAPTASAGTNTTQIATTAYVIAEIAARFAANDAMQYKGAIDASGNPNYPAANAGDTYRFSVAGKIGGASGVNVQAGDMMICHVDASAGGTHASVGADWDVIQLNIDGALTTASIGVSVQAYDADLDAIAALSPSNDDVVQRKGGVWTNRTIAQLKTDLGVSGTNTGDQTSIVGITGTLAQFNTAISDANLIPEGGGTFTGDISVPDEAYDATAWNGSTEVPTKNAIRDKIEAITISKYSGTVGNGSATSFSITQGTHGKAADSSNDVIVEVASTGVRVYPAITVNPANGTVTVDFGATVPTTNQFRVFIY